MSGLARVANCACPISGMTFPVSAKGPSPPSSDSVAFLRRPRDPRHAMCVAVPISGCIQGRGNHDPFHHNPRAKPTASKCVLLSRHRSYSASSDVDVALPSSRPHCRRCGPGRHARLRIHSCGLTRPSFSLPLSSSLKTMRQHSASMGSFQSSIWFPMVHIHSWATGVRLITRQRQRP